MVLRDGLGSALRMTAGALVVGAGILGVSATPADAAYGHGGGGRHGGGWGGGWHGGGWGGGWHGGGWGWGWGGWAPGISVGLGYAPYYYPPVYGYPYAYGPGVYYGRPYAWGRYAYGRRW